MTFEVLTDTLNRISEISEEVITDAKEIAPLGSIKPEEYGCLMKRKLAEKTENQKAEKLSPNEVPSDNDFTAFSTQYSFYNENVNNTHLDYSPNELAQETADRLYDADITLKNWDKAFLIQREEMFDKAVDTVGKEMQISPKELNSLKQEMIPSARESLLKSDFITAMSDIYFNMSKIKNAVSLDCIQGEAQAFYKAESYKLNENQFASYNDDKILLQKAYFINALNKHNRS